MLIKRIITVFALVASFNLAAQIYGPTVVCTGGFNSVTYYTDVLSSTYTWSVTGGVKGNCSGSGTSCANVFWTGGTMSITLTTDGGTTTLNVSEPQAYASVTDNNVCSGETVTLTINPGGGTFQEWQSSTNGGSSWSFLSSSATAPVIMFGNTQFRAKVNNTCGTIYSDVETVTVNSLPTGYNVTGGGSYCSGGSGVSIGLSDSQTGVNYQLRRNGLNVGSPVSGTNNAISFGNQTATGTYTVVGTNTSTSCSATMVGSKTVSVNAVPALASGSGQSRCGSGTISLSATPGSNGNTIRWYNASSGGTLLHTGTIYTPTVSSTTTYYAASYNSTTGCQDADRKAITATVVTPPVGGTLNGGTEEFGVATGTLTLSGYVGSIVKWQYRTTGSWIDIANTGTTQGFTNLQETHEYRVVVDNGICTEAYSSVATVSVLALPTVNLGSTQELRPGQETTLTATSGHSNYEWFRNGTQTQNGASNTLVVDKPGMYKVTVTSTGSATYTTGEAEISNQLELENENAVITYNYRIPVTDASDPFIYSNNEQRIATQIYDGLGRPIQSVALQASPDAKDVVTPVEYDVYGRQTKSYLPYVDQDLEKVKKANALNELNYLTSDHYTFYNQTHSTAKAFAETRFEASPLNRPLEQAAPGEAWAIGGNKTMSYAYDAADSAEVIKWDYDSLLTGARAVYDSAMIFKNTVTDEDGNQTIEYIDRVGRTVLKKSQIDGSNWASTYYIYDDYSQLMAVIPPEAESRLDADFFAQSQPARENFLNLWAFLYEYDGRGRMTMKKVPGADTVLMVYDKWDRLVLTQDGNQRAKAIPEWLFTKYDALNRPIMTGIMSSSDTESTIRSAVASETDRFETFDAAGTNEYTDVTYPANSLVDNYLTVTYYDNYDWNNTGLTFTNPVGLTQNIAVKGQVTGTLTKTGNGSWIKSASYYDNKYRVIQTQSTNHLGGTDIVSNYYDFIGQVTKSISSHNDGITTTEITRTFEYDHVGRLLKTYHQLSSGDSVLIAENNYNELGELIEKDLHGRTQSLDYTYNVRGWLTSMNKADLSGGDGDLFGMELFYDSLVSSLSNSQLYNGNISAMKWSNYDAPGDQIDERAYNFSYDKLNRLKTASHFQDNAATNKYGVQGLVYDRNGNIESLQRRAESTTLYMDNLSYTYSGNQLEKVSDVASDTTGFYDGHTGNIDYEYDANGNMVKDRNKGIDSIYYNHLNLPILVDFSTPGDSIEYLYDAAGIKLQQKVWKDDTLRKITDYIGEFIYETDTSGIRELQLVQHEEGRLVPEYEKVAQDISWTFDSDTEGFVIGNRLTSLQYAAPGYLHGVIAAADPYLRSPDNLNFEASDYDKIVIRMKNSTTGDIGQVYFTTTTSTAESESKHLDFDILPNSDFTTYTIDISSVSTWEGTIKRLRIDPSPVGTGTFDIDWVRVEAKTAIGDYDYQYHLKDHLGNVRMTFSTTPENYTMVETFETGEDNGWQDLHRFTSSNANTTVGGDEVERLQSGQTGAMIFINVNNRDTVNLSVKANYESAPTNNNFLGTTYTTLFNSFDNIYGSGAENGVTSTSSVFDDALGGAQMSGKGNTSTAPRAFLNYIIFDRDMNYVTAGFQQISTAALGIGVHETISINDILPEQDGYILAYLSNENQEAVNVHWDDFTVYHGKTNVVSTQDYYPFGLTFNESVRVASTEQRFKYNGFEYMDDHGLNLLDYQARYYDPALGRFIQVDPLTEVMRRWSPYTYAFNNPIRFIDPDGMMATDPNNDNNLNDDINAGVSQGIQNRVTGFLSAVGDRINNPSLLLDDAKSTLNGITNLLTSEGSLAGKIGEGISNNVDAKLERIGNAENPANEFGQVLGETQVDVMVAAGTEGASGLGGKGTGLIDDVADASKVDNIASTVDSNVSADIINNIPEGGLPRIQNAADNIGSDISLVGSRANGTATPTSDFDYVIPNATSRQIDKVKNSLPGAPSRINSQPRRIDFFRGNVDTNKPYITVKPRN